MTVRRPSGLKSRLSRSLVGASAVAAVVAALSLASGPAGAANPASGQFASADGYDSGRSGDGFHHVRGDCFPDLPASAFGCFSGDLYADQTVPAVAVTHYCPGRRRKS